MCTCAASCVHRMTLFISPGAVRTTMNRRHLDFNEFLTFRGFNPQLASVKALTRFLKMQFFSSFLCNIREEAIWFPFSTHRPRSATCKLWGGAAPQSVRARPRICRIFPHAPTGGGPTVGPTGPQIQLPKSRPPASASQIKPTQIWAEVHHGQVGCLRI